MYWNSIADFLDMGGYAVYVWGSFGVCALCMLIEVAGLLRRVRVERRRLIRQLLARRDPQV